MAPFGGPGVRYHAPLRNSPEVRMRRLLPTLFVTMFLTAAAVVVAQQTKPAAAKPEGAQPASEHVMMTPDQLKWGPAPPALPPGAQAAVISGDPGKAGLFTIRLKFSDGYTVPPHMHPTDEYVTVLSGTLTAGLGDKLDAASMHTLPAGGFARMPRRTNHYVRAKGETVVQVHAMGPFELTYANPNDDPRKKTAMK
jgi:quercetin dioxygenase-like cupin family protein